MREGLLVFNFETIIGVEVHCALNTRSKMFSPAANSHDDTPNTNLHVNDLGLPGTLPQPNAAAIQKAFRLAKALNMVDVDTCLRFDRKNYFYQDLPKGFQITQQYHPFAKNGHLDAYLDEQPIAFKIQRFHIEEDTAKQFVSPSAMLLDYNRAGAPLIEIVTDPVFRSAAEVRAYLTWLRWTLLHNDVSDARMEAGSMRADINLSLRPVGAKNYGTRVEIKNINSIANVQKAIDSEVASQIARMLAGIPIQQATMRYDDASGQTQFMRAKTDAIDYRYMREPNIVQIQLDEAFVTEALTTKPIFYPAAVFKTMRAAGLDAAQCAMLLDEPALLAGFNLVQAKWGAKVTARWLLTELAGILKKQDVAFSELSTADYERISAFIALVETNKISGRQGKELLPVVITKKQDPQQLASQMDMQQVDDPQTIRSALSKIIADNEDKVKSGYVNRPERIEAMLLGLLMKQTKGQANPVVAATILKELLSAYATDQQVKQAPKN